MNKMIAGGCSFTGDYTCAIPNVDNKFDRWPSIVGKNLSLEVVNLGEQGISNHTIAHRVISYLSKWHKNIEQVFILWTDWNRLDFLYNQGRYTSTAMIKLNEQRQSYRDEKVYFFYEEVTSKYKALRNMLYDYHNPVRSNSKFAKLQIKPKDVVMYNLMPYKNVELACKAYNIKYKFLQGLNIHNIAYIDCSDQKFFCYSDGSNFDNNYERFEKEVDETILMNDFNFDKSILLIEM